MKEDFDAADSSNGAVSINSDSTPVDPGSLYEMRARIVGLDGCPGNAYLALLFMDSKGFELQRRIRWINDYSGVATDYVIRAQAPAGAVMAIRGYRISQELPLNHSVSTARLLLQPVNSVALLRSRQTSESYDRFVVDPSNPNQRDPAAILDIEVPAQFWNVPPNRAMIEVCSPDPHKKGRSTLQAVTDEVFRRDISYFARVICDSDPQQNKEAVGSYLSFHMDRFLKSFHFIPPGTGEDRILELGAFYPFTLCIYRHSGYSEIRCADYRPMTEDRPHIERSFYDRLQGVGLTLVTEPLNLDTDPFPYDDGYFTTVVCMETLEHLIADPMHMMEQINRVLKPGGNVVISTPNVTSIASLTNILQGRHPCGSNAYSKEGILPMRHNREYTPDDIVGLLQAAGFEVVRFETTDVWQQPDAKVIAAVSTLGYSTTLRGDCMMMLGRKVHDGIRTRYPSPIYA
jgi:SAM-dependent methyltransferase